MKQIKKEAQAEIRITLLCFFDCVTKHFAVDLVLKFQTEAHGIIHLQAKASCYHHQIACCDIYHIGFLVILYGFQSL